MKQPNKKLFASATLPDIMVDKNKRQKNSQNAHRNF